MWALTDGDVLNVKCLCTFSACYQSAVVHSELLLMEEIKARHSNPALSEDGISKTLSK